MRRASSVGCPVYGLVSRFGVVLVSFVSLFAHGGRVGFVWVFVVFFVTSFVSGFVPLLQAIDGVRAIVL